LETSLDGTARLNRFCLEACVISGLLLIDERKIVSLKTPPSLICDFLPNKKL
jgi:hypothetical protein